MKAKQLLNDKKFWFASFLIGWAAALQGHMMWLQRQDSFKQKFGTLNQNDNDSNGAHEFRESFVHLGYLSIGQTAYGKCVELSTESCYAIMY
ncbi:conserved hypothetical protein [Ricinus communis]|uniref:Uncharacterized protein n=1 Tax=Ricinus communis TaxID=3988 RepID=B9T144_RICCO|nr:conserved hypothetical protein [Ricinus communis]